jgi:hypothetical protein
VLGKQRLVDGDRLARTSYVAVCAGEVTARAERVGVFRAEDPLTVGQQQFMYRDRLPAPSCPVMGGRQMVTGGERGGMVSPEDTFGAGEGEPRSGKSPPAGLSTVEVIARPVEQLDELLGAIASARECACERKGVR